MLLLPPFDYYEPTDLTGALKLLSELNGDGKIIAGGTDILVKMKKGEERPKALMGLQRVEGLAAVERRGRGVSIGPLVTAAGLRESPVIQSVMPVLGRAASTLGSPLIRNRATIGGNLATARPAADLPPALLALDGRVRLASLRGEREVPLGKFFLGPGRTVLDGDELIREVYVDEPPPFTGVDYIKLGHRRALEIAITAVAARITLETPDGMIAAARIILSSVAPTAIRARSAEAVVVGEMPCAELFRKAALAAGTECTPITDTRGSAEYRCAMVGVLTERALAGAFESARHETGRNC